MNNVDFSVDLPRMSQWMRRMGVDHPMQLSEPYAQPYLFQKAELLVEFHGFRRIEPVDHRILFAIIYNPPSGAATSPAGDLIELPTNVGCFFSPERRLQWEQVFHSNVWFDCGCHVPGASAATDILHMLQCLVPGMLLVTEDKSTRCTQRGIPPLHWLCENKEILEVSLGYPRFAALCQAAADMERVVIDSGGTALAF